MSVTELRCCLHVASKGYLITVIMPGNQTAAIFRVVQALASEFDQTVLLGYPPFLKDMIDSGMAEGISWQNYRIKWVSAGEVFSGAWQSPIAQRIGSTSVCYDSASFMEPQMRAC